MLDVMIKHDLAASVLYSKPQRELYYFEAGSASTVTLWFLLFGTSPVTKFHYSIYGIIEAYYGNAWNMFVGSLIKLLFIGLQVRLFDV